MPSRAGCWIAAAGIFLLVAVLVVHVLGLVLVTDRGAGVVAARLVTSDGQEQRLYRLPGGRFVGIPRLEGEVEVRCSDGSTDRVGYVHPHTHTRVVVERGPTGAACRAREARRGRRR